MKAITTKILHTTNTKPTRIKCQAEDIAPKVWSKFQIEGLLIDAGQSLNEENIHHFAACRFAELNQWPTRLASGSLPVSGHWAHCWYAEEASQEKLERTDALLQAREALQFYADAEKWNPVDTGIGEIDGDALDYGATAREALEQIKMTTWRSLTLLPTTSHMESMSDHTTLCARCAVRMLTMSMLNATFTQARFTPQNQVH